MTKYSFWCAVIVLSSLALLVACGGAAPSTADQAVATIGASVQQPTTAPTVAANLSGLGLTRAEVQAKFEGAPFNTTFKDAPADEDGPVVRGTSVTKVDVILHGPAGNIHQAQISALIGDQQATSGDVLRAMIALLEVAAPKIKNPTDWLVPHLDTAIKTGGDTAIEADRTIMLIVTKQPPIIILSVLPNP